MGLTERKNLEIDRKIMSRSSKHLEIWGSKISQERLQEEIKVNIGLKEGRAGGGGNKTNVEKSFSVISCKVPCRLFEGRIKTRTLGKPQLGSDIRCCLVFGEVNLIFKNLGHSWPLPVILQMQR